MSKPTRREVLGGIGATAAASWLPGCIANSSGDTLDSPIDTFVVMMMENRSFDHYFGALSLEEGRSDADGLQPEHHNLDLAGETVRPFRLSKECLVDPPHGWNSSHRQFAEGENSGFVQEHRGGVGSEANEVMGYHNREDLPVYYALADDGAICNRWFASVMGPTWPNRLYSLCGTSAGETGNDMAKVPFTMTSIFDQLTEHGIEWAIYVHDVPFAALLDGIRALPDGEQVRHIDQFFLEAAEGRLPAVCFIDPGFTFGDDHPPHPPMLGQLSVGSVYQALADSPHWERCLMVVDYDEHGGFYDHVAPPTVPDDLAEQGFDQLGFRVPALVLGPWVKRGTIDEVFDHTSVLATLQRHFGMPALSERNQQANDLSSCLDLVRIATRRPRAPTKLPTLTARREDYEASCFFAAESGQPELQALADSGFIRPEWDFRGVQGDTLRTMFARAQRMGLLGPAGT